MNVDWVKLFQTKNGSEDLIATLLVRIYPGAVRIDGSGGDGGRDVQLDADGVRTIWEVKGFPDRLSRSKTRKTRKTQILKSLATAAGRNPKHWWLVLPLDFNTTEDAWFEGLKTEYPFIAGYRGLTWLNGELAKHPDLVRSSRTASDELLALAGQHNMETAVMTRGVADALDRAAALGKLTNELDPDYAFELHAGPDGVSRVTIIPKHEGAPLIEMNVQVAFGPEDEELRAAVETALDYGDPDGVEVPDRVIRSVRLSGPAALGLDGAGSLIGGGLTISGPVDEIDVPVQLKVFGPGQWLPVAAMSFRMRKRGRGRIASTQVGRDAAGTIELRTVFPRLEPGATVAPEVKLEIHGVEAGGIYAVNALPAARLIAASRAPNVYRLYIDNRHLGDAPCLVQDPEAIEDAVAMAEAIGHLAFIQETTGHMFPMPDEFTIREMRDLAKAAALLRGEDVDWIKGSITITLHDHKVVEFLAELDQGGLYAIEVEHLVTMEIGGEAIELCPIRLWTPSAALRNRKTLQRYRPGGKAEPKAVLAPADKRFIATRIPGFTTAPGNVRSAPVGTPPTVSA